MTQTLGLTLREQLTGRTDPDFTLRMLPGWERRTPDDDDLADREAALKKRCMEAHRPDLYGPTRTMLRESHAAMRRERALAYYTPASGEDTLWIPGGIIASIRHAPDGGSLDELMARTIQRFGATPLFGDKRFIRFERDGPQRVPGGTVGMSSIIYLTPVPGSRRRRALQLTATHGRPLEVDADAERVRQTTMAFDLCVSTLAWVSPSG